MKTREFDPVLSAALRNELEALPGSADAAPVARLRRPQLWVTAVTALVLITATVGVLRLTASHDAQPAREVQIVDPLSRITDPEDPAYLPNGVWSLLHLGGTGPATYELEVPEGTTSVRPLLACAPSADFRITVGLAYWTACDPQGATGYGDIPVSPGRQPIAVHVPAGVRWRLAVIETPEEGTTYSTLRVTGAPAAPTPPAPRFPAPAREEDVPVGVASGGSGTSTGTLFAPVDGLALVTSCRGSGGLVVSLSNGIRLGTDAAPLPCGTPAQASAESVGADTAKGYRGDGRLRWTVRAVGDVRWTATFSSRTEERLEYPAVDGDVLGRARGSGEESQGALSAGGPRVRVVITCRGDGGVGVSLFRAGTGIPQPRRVVCGSDAAERSDVDLTAPAGTGTIRYSVRPTGDVLWTATFTTSG